jgi:hypothetical protein
VALSGSATVGEAVGADVGDVMVEVTDGLADAVGIGVATGDGAPEAAVEKQIVSAITLRARRYRIIGNGRIARNRVGARVGNRVAMQPHYHQTYAASISVAVREAALGPYRFADFNEKPADADCHDETVEKDPATARRDYWRQAVGKLPASGVERGRRELASSHTQRTNVQRYPA